MHRSAAGEQACAHAAAHPGGHPGGQLGFKAFQLTLFLVGAPQVSNDVRMLLPILVGIPVVNYGFEGFSSPCIWWERRR